MRTPVEVPGTPTGVRVGCVLRARAAASVGRTRAAAVLAFVGTLASCGPAVPPAPSDILDGARAALLNVTTLTYRSRYESASESRPEAGYEITGEVAIERTGTGPDDYLGRAWIRRDGEAGDLEMAFDGVRARFIDHSSRVMMEADLDNGGDDIIHSSPPVLLFFADALFEDPLWKERTGATGAEYRGRETVDGVPCHVIHVVHDRGALQNDLVESTWWIGVDDLLPRRYVRFFDTPEGAATQGLTLGGLTAGRTPEHEFFLSMPTGYAFEPLPGAVGAPLAVGTEAPPFSLPGPDGREQTLAEHGGEVVVMTFWATWCGWCRVGLAELESLRADYEPRGVTVLGVSYRESEASDPIAFLEREGFGLTTLLNGERIEDLYQVGSVPTYYVIARSGRIVYSQVGHGADVGPEIRSVLDAELGADAER